MNPAAIALFAVTFATLLNSIGYILFKLAHVKSERVNCNYICTKEYFCGISFLILGVIINVGMFMNFLKVLVSLAYADIITLSSTSALTMVFNCLLATSVLGEIFTRYDLLSIVLISMGASLCVIFSNYSTKDIKVPVFLLFDLL